MCETVIFGIFYRLKEMGQNLVFLQHVARIKVYEVVCCVSTKHWLILKLGAFFMLQ